MNCKDTRYHIQLWLQAAGTDAGSEPDGESLRHIKCCSACRLEYGDAVLDQLLRQQSAPVARDGFFDRAIIAAVQRNTGASQLWGRGFGALAASVAAVALVVGLWGGVPGTSSRDVARDAGVAQILHEAQTVRVLIDSVAARDRATITIELAENLELEGFPNQRVIEWQTDLLAGRNLLALPVRLKDQGESYLDVSLHHGDEQKAIRVSVRPAGTSMQLGALPIRA
jgi:hypothetical protein